MKLNYWAPQKMPLRPEQVDHNFQQIEQAIQSVSERIDVLQHAFKTAPNPIQAIAFEPGGLTFRLADGRMIQVGMPPFPMVFRGVWSPGTDYAAHDIVQRDQEGLYRCGQSHVSTQDFSIELWQKIWDWPKPKGEMQVKGIWKSGQTYRAGDWVQHGTFLYTCLQDHVAQEGQDPSGLSQMWTVVYGLSFQSQNGV